MRTLFAAALLAVIPACPPSPSPPDSGTDAGSLDAGASVCALACANLSVLGCAEGLDASCVATCEHAQSTHLTDLHPTCLVSARSKQEARACQSVKCP
jgi:hypothetical protein